MSHSVTTAPLKDAVPPGASLAYNIAAVHGARPAEAAQAAPATCALLRPAARREMPAVPPCAIQGEEAGALSSPVRPEPVEGQVPHPCAAPGASTGSARTGEGGDAAPQGHALLGAALAAGVAEVADVVGVGAAGAAGTAATAATAGTGGVADVVAAAAGAGAGGVVAGAGVVGVVASAAAGSGATANTSDISGSADAEVDAATATTTAPATGPAALRCAIAHCGGQSALASAIGLSQSHVWNWLNRRSIPAEHCPAIERATNRAVRCEALRPDVDWAYLRAVCEELASVRDEA